MILPALCLSHDYDADLPVSWKSIYTNDQKITVTHSNFNFIYLTFVFSLNRQFLKQIVDKYFKRLRQLLKEKYYAIFHRLDIDKENKKRTKTFIRFSSGEHVIYIGFHHRCEKINNDTFRVLPPAFVTSKNRWRCGHYVKSIPLLHRTHTLAKDPRFYKDQMKKMLTKGSIDQ